MSYKRVDTELIKLVLRTPEGERVDWPTSVRGVNLRNHRDHITDQARRSGKYKLEGDTLFYRIKFCESIPPMGPEGTVIGSTLKS